MSNCVHQPERQPGNKCECLECRTARSKALANIAQQCHRCAGEMATDHQGQLTCALKICTCPVLDLWMSANFGHIDPAELTPALVELVFKGIRQPPRIFDRVEPKSSISEAVRDFTLTGYDPEKTLSIDGSPVAGESERPADARSARVLVIASEPNGQAIRTLLEQICPVAVVDWCVAQDGYTDLADCFERASEMAYDTVYVLAMLDKVDTAVEATVSKIAESGTVVVALSPATDPLSVPARLRGVISVVPSRKKPSSAKAAARFAIADETPLSEAEAVGAFVASEVTKVKDISRLPSAVIYFDRVFTVGCQGV